MEENLISTETIPEAIANADVQLEFLTNEQAAQTPESTDEGVAAPQQAEPESDPTEEPERKNKEVPYHLLGIEPPDENDPGLQLVESLDKPAEEYGPLENSLEASMALAQGIFSAVESFGTAGPRYKDMLEGKDPGDPNYVPSWAPFSVSHPILKTKWGQIAETVAHYTTIGAGLYKMGLTEPTLLAGASAAISNKSQQPNSDPLNSFRTLMPFLNDIPVLNTAIDTFAVDDLDHPLMKTAKNVLQEMGLAKAFDAALSAFFGNNPKYKQLEAEQTANVDRQIEEMAIYQVEVQDLGPTPPPRLPGQEQPLLPPAEFDGYVNKPVADMHQGNATPTGKPSKVLKQLNQIDAENIDGGSTDPIFTRAQVRRMADNNGMGAAEMREIAEDLLSDEAYRNLVEGAYESRKSVAEVFGPSFRRYQQIIGHDAMKLPPEEFWKEILDDAPMQTGAGPASPNLTAISTENVVVTDLVVSHLFKQAQTQAKALREIMSYGDIWAKSGPMQGLRDNLVFGLGQARRARKLASYNLLKLRQSKNPLKISQRDLPSPEEFAKELDDVFADTRTNIDFFFEVVEKMDDPELNSAIIEIFSSSENTRNWMDLEAYMRKKVRGGDLNGRITPGQLRRELDAVWINSALNSVKTPQRALIGTAEYTFLRTLSRFFGAKIRGAMGFARGKQVDPINQAEATAQMVAYFEALPDAWKVFYSKIKGNFSKPTGTYDNRFSRYSSNEFNWNLAEKFYKEQRRGDFMDRRMYDIAKSGWWLNGRRLASWSNRVLSPIDDAWRFVQAKQRAKTLAVREVMEGVKRGDFAELTPELMKQADELYFNRLLDDEGNIDIFKDPYLQKITQEDTLTTPLEGAPKALVQMANENWFFSRFAAFATPAWNDIVMNVKNTPIVGAFLDESRAIMSATADDFVEKAGKYGIKNVRDLEAAKDDIIGRQAIGAIVAGSYLYKHMQGEAKGPGSVDSKQKTLTKQFGRKDNFEYYGAVGIPSNALQTHWLMKAAIGLVMDNAHKMGPEWVDNSIWKIGSAIAATATDSTMLKNINELMEMLTLSPEAGLGRITGSLTNTQVPLGGLRNDVGNALDGALKEVNSDLISSIKNRNKWLGSVDNPLTRVPGEPLPDKKNMLNGKKINEQNPLVMFFNAVSAIPLDIADDSRALEAIERSNLDLSMATWFSPDGDSLQDYPDLRSAFQGAIGDWRDDKGNSFEDRIIEIYDRPETQRTIEQMERDVGLTTKVLDFVGNFIETKETKAAKERLGNDPMFYAHNVAYKNLLDQVRSEAYATLRDREDFQEVEEKSREQRQRNAQLNIDSVYDPKKDNLETIRNLNNP